MRRKWITMGITFLLCLASFSFVALAENTLVVEDGAGLFTEEQIQSLQTEYASLTEYMDAAVVTTSEYSSSTAYFAESYAIEHYGNDPSILFVIDMYNRQIYVYANGDAQKTVSRADARAITDNIYQQASAGNYYGCASGALSQILTRCQGQRLARPVKHITNAMIAILLGILLNYFVMSRSRRARAERRTSGTVNVNAARNMAIIPGIGLAVPIVISSVRHYHNTDSDGGGGGFGGGGFSGGGGHSGGGGGHSF